ncbi:MAG TPA: prephenate dehydrogenase/arogenate dehydrogenase family protein [Dysgonamonadaceae bacterium]|nr:prephenate dehydrogenase/arogenate dehydrogenase family protein [Dysgonamonadaceae bacterium]
MRILIVGAGKMGSFFADLLSFDHEVALLDTDPKKLRFIYNVQRMTLPEDVEAFNPEMVINAATLAFTIDAFKTVLPYISQSCILSDIASVKTGLKAFYESAERPYVSTHPMFGPTFASLNDLSTQSAIIISESDHLGKVFFRDLYNSVKLNVFEYSFDKHDKTIAYSLSIPFASTLVFASVMKHQDAPGTTFKRHLSLAEGLLSEDDYLLSEILFNPYTSDQVEKIREKLKELLHIIKEKDSEHMKQFLTQVRKNIE